MEEDQAAPELLASTARNQTSTKDPAPRERRAARRPVLELRSESPRTTRTRYRTLDRYRQHLPSRATLAREFAQRFSRTRHRPQALDYRKRLTERSLSRR